MNYKSSVRLFAVVALCATLTACKSVEERVEETFASAISLFEDGDADRAIVQLRNVLKLDGQHRDARWMLADIHLNERNNVRSAYSQLLRLAEQYPEDLEVRVLLSELAFQIRNFEEFERHSAAAQDLGPDDPRVELLGLALRYRAAAVAEDAEALDSTASEARAALASSPESEIVRSIVIDSYVRAENFPAALENIDTLLESNPDSRVLLEQRLAVVVQMEDADLIEENLLRMVSTFEDDTELQSTLLRFYIANNEPDKAEAYLRNISSPADEDPGAFVDLIRFVSQTKGQEAGMVEIERAIAENPNPGPFRALRAALWFTEGRQDEAIAELEDVIATSEPSDSLNGTKVTLAQMFVSQGNDVGARSLVEEVIAEDPLNADALKIRASWRIESDEVELAISDLRSALDAAPDDSGTMTLMSQAYTRLGSHELARDFLSRAADASNNAPVESLRYANLLIDEEQFLPAEDALIASLRLNPGNEDLLEALGRVYLLMEDNARLRQVIDTLRNRGSDRANAVANALEAELLNQVSGTEEAMAFLEEVANSEGSGVGGQLSLLRGRIATGDLEGARNLLATLLESDPESIALRSVSATISGLSGDTDQAETAFREILAEDPSLSRNWLELARLLSADGRRDEATSVVDEAIAANPNDAGLLWAKASFLEQDGDIDGAIAVYEGLYAQSSSSLVVANNLASLLATYKDDEESLDRAYILARRLQGTEIPQFQDTIGWILHRRGDHEEALPYLEQSAAALQDDPIAQFHLGMVQVALGQNEAALSQLQSAVDLAGSDDQRPQFLVAREEIIRLQNQ